MPTDESTMTPTDNDATAEGTTWSAEVRPKCSRCDRLAAVYGTDGEPLCARHGTFFVTRKGQPND